MQSATLRPLSVESDRRLAGPPCSQELPLENGSKGTRVRDCMRRNSRKFLCTPNRNDRCRKVRVDVYASTPHAVMNYMGHVDGFFEPLPSLDCAYRACEDRRGDRPGRISCLSFDHRVARARKIARERHAEIHRDAPHPPAGQRRCVRTDLASENLARISRRSSRSRCGGLQRARFSAHPVVATALPA
jgi:hypothetical protein